MKFLKKMFEGMDIIYKLSNIKEIKFKGVSENHFPASMDKSYI